MGRIPGPVEVITSKDFTDEFFQTLKKGQILGFYQPDGSKRHWRASKLVAKDCYARLQPWEVYDNLEDLEVARAVRNS